MKGTRKTLAALGLGLSLIFGTILPQQTVFAEEKTKGIRGGCEGDALCVFFKQIFPVSAKSGIFAVGFCRQLCR